MNKERNFRRNCRFRRLDDPFCRRICRVCQFPETRLPVYLACLTIHLTNLPAHLVNLPVHLVSLPAHLTCPPSHLARRAGQISTLPSHLACLPGHLAHLPIHLVRLPIHLVRLTGRLAHLPVHLACLPTHLASLPAHLACLPEHLERLKVCIFSLFLHFFEDLTAFRQLLDLPGQPFSLFFQLGVFNFKLLRPFCRQFIQNARLPLRQPAKLVIRAFAQRLQRCRAHRDFLLQRLTIILLLLVKRPDW